MEAEEIAKLGRNIYMGIRAEMEANEWGRMVVIDVNSGDYENCRRRPNGAATAKGTPTKCDDMGRAGRIPCTLLS